MGPLVDSRAMNGVAHLRRVRVMRAESWVRVRAREKDGGLERGHFFSPTVIEAKQGMEKLRKRYSVRWWPFSSSRFWKRGSKIAIGWRYGLTSTIFTRDVSKSFVRRARASGESFM